MSIGNGSFNHDLISSYGLYQEEPSSNDPELIHIENIRTRAELFDWTIRIHNHPNMFQLVYVERGYVRIHVDGYDTEQEGPCLVTIPHSVAHGFEFSETTTCGLVVTVSQILVMEERFQRECPFYDDLFSKAHINSLTFSETEFFNYVLKQLREEYEQEYPGRNVMFEWLLFSLLTKVGRKLEASTHNQKKSGRYEVRFKRLSAMIEQHYKEHQKIQFYADQLHTTCMGINRTCNVVAGKSLNELLQNRLILEAQRYLIYTSAPASLIAYDLGFKDPAYFSRFFKRRVGLTPGEFREQREKS